MAELVDIKADRIEEIWNLLEPVAASGGMEILEIEYRRESIKIHIVIGLAYAGVAQLVEHKLPKLGVAGSNPVARSRS